jgi:MYXO-CTERM domain-containing protein
VSRRIAALALIVLLPLTLAAADPRGDAVPCLRAHGGGNPPDLVAAVGRASEEGSSATWRLIFAHPLRVPDPTDPPFRVDVVIRDPKVPAVSFGDYRDFNRIVRFDATDGNAHLELLFIAEGGHTLFDPPVIDGDTMTIRMPGRLLLGADEFGRAAMQRLRWSVVVRDGGRCDLLGNGIPSYRMATVAPPTSSPTASAVPSTTPAPSASNTPVVGVAAIAVAGLAVLTLFALRRRR